MESIGLFEAKTHLSELVARAERGEEVIITRHQRPVAKLVPIAAPQPVVLIAAAAAWSSAFLLYLWVFTPWLTSTRLDGKDG